MLSGLLAAAVVAVAAWACGGDGGVDGSGDIDPEAQALLPQMVLTEEDLPAGVQQVSASFSTNQDVANAVIDSEAELAKLEGWGRVLGHDTQFEPGPEAPVDSEVQGVQSTVSLYATPEGARDSFADAASSARAMDWSARYPGVLDLEVEEIERSDLADERVWFRISGFDENSGRLVIDDQVAIRVGSVRGFVRVVAVFDPTMPRDAYLDQVETWARLVADRTEAALAAGEVSATATP